MEALAARGHRVRVVSRVENFGQKDQAKLLAQLQSRGVAADPDDGAVRMELNGVDVRTLALNPQLRTFFQAQIEEFDPDIIVTSTDDPAHLLYELAVRAARARVVFLVRATIAVPFGPDSAMLSAEKTGMLRRADSVVGVSNYVANYVEQWSGIPAVHVPISLLERQEFPQVGGWANRYIAMVNPCLVKGLTIFLQLADRMPGQAFAAVPTWGTTADDLAEMRKRQNVSILEPVDDINDLLRVTKIMLVPSVWAEARSRVVLEAMACGVPVVASDVGGLHEAHLGVPYLLPVNRVTHYKPTLDRNMVPIAEVPPQDVAPWQEVLERLAGDESHFNDIARQSRAAALDYAANLNVEPFEALLLHTLEQPKKGIAPAPAPKPELSDNKRKLLALRLKLRGGAAPNSWFAGTEDPEAGEPALFCFPYAGGGTSPYRTWREALPDISVVAVRLPGRENRAQEPPFESMESLIEALGPEFLKIAKQPFAFYGHSMGAGIAFELTRWLRRRGKPLPFLLAVSSARAPQLRSEPVAELDDEALVDRLRTLGGMPPEVAEKPELLNLFLPAIRSDARLYSRYVYQAEQPLDIPLAVYGGAGDPSLESAHLDAWCDQTTASCARKDFPGGHFFFRQSRGEFLEALGVDVGEKLRLPSQHGSGFEGESKAE